MPFEASSGFQVSVLTSYSGSNLSKALLQQKEIFHVELQTVDNTAAEFRSINAKLFTFFWIMHCVTYANLRKPAWSHMEVSVVNLWISTALHQRNRFCSESTLHRWKPCERCSSTWERNENFLEILSDSGEQRKSEDELWGELRAAITEWKLNWFVALSGSYHCSGFLMQESESCRELSLNIYLIAVTHTLIQPQSSDSCRPAAWRQRHTPCSLVKCRQNTHTHEHTLLLQQLQ